MRRRVLVGAVSALLVALTISSAAAQSAPLEVRTRDVSFGNDGVTHITVSVTGGSLGSSTLDQSNFGVTEQGKPVTGLTVRPLFSNQTIGVQVVLIIDVSGSTGGAAHAAAQAAAKQFVDSLPQHVQIELISFGDTATVRQDFTTNKGAIDSAIDALTVSGNTALYDAVVLGAHELSRQQSGQHNIVLFTDGDDTRSKASLTDAENAIRDANAPTTGVLLKTSSVNGSALQAITNTVKGGRFLQVTDRAQLASSFQQASQSIASQYVLSYPSTATTPKQLNLVVTTNFGGQTASDSSVVLNQRGTVSPPGGNGPVAATPQKPLVGAFGNRIGLYLGIGAAFLGVLLFEIGRAHV